MNYYPAVDEKPVASSREVSSHIHVSSRVGFPPKVGLTHIHHVLLVGLPCFYILNTGRFQTKIWGSV